MGVRLKGLVSKGGGGRPARWARIRVNAIQAPAGRMTRRRRSRKKRPQPFIMEAGRLSLEGLIME